ncbi:MAG: glycosyltransferase family 2 protein [Planctomycetota bacterium]
MKLIIQIPCWNEEAALPLAFAALPREVPGFDVVETLVIDDGSTDRTVEVARELGVTHVVQLVTHQGLAAAFQRGLHECLARGADVVVNTDADNQYVAGHIPRLTEPIVAGRADYVVGDRSVESLPHFSWIKKKLQRFGSYVVRVASRTRIPDTTSGFRAISREAALQLFVHSNYTYTHETLIQAGQKNVAVESVKVGVNPVVRPSRLFKSIPRYVLRSADTIVRIYLIYNAWWVLSRVALLLFLVALSCLVTHGVLAWHPDHQPPGWVLLAVGGGILGAALAVFLAAVLADLLAVNRRLQEEALTHLRRLTFAPSGNESGPDSAQGEGSGPRGDSRVLGSVGTQSPERTRGDGVSPAVQDGSRGEPSPGKDVVNPR